MRELFKKKISVEHLKTGMYITELDMPWLDSPFLLQGFSLISEEDVAKVQKICTFVYIDSQRGLDVDPKLVIELPPSENPADVKTNIDKVVYIDKISFEQEVERANEIRVDTKRIMTNLYESAKMSTPLDIQGAKEVVDELVDSVIRNPDAQMLLTQLKKKDEYTLNHSMNVCVMSLTFGRHLGLPKEDLKELGLGAMMHDLGKMKVSDAILKKPSKLTEEEMEVMRTHPDEGRKLLMAAPENISARVIEVAYSHHERMDGAGYPQGMDGESIPVFARMVMLVDFYDAVTSDRAYHHGESSSDAMRTIYEERGIRFDADLSERFIQCMGVFPLGSLVELGTDEVGIVISLNRERHLKPKILLLLDKNKRKYDVPKILDLSRFTKPGQQEIRHVLEPNAYDLDIRTYLHDLSWAV
ncbi:MAG: cyclic di-GMP phosphodiesterase [Gammaproteobacteria bacterium]|nr:MAG: cyclic di-GMP phosphodiesterase [Gammaproteobacteria bacterium]